MRCLPHEEDPTLVQILVLDSHQDPQWLQANIQMQFILCSTFSHLIPP